MTLKAAIFAAFMAVAAATDANASVGAFWLGVDAKVETKVKVDQRVLDTINSLPVEIRKQTVLAANQIIDNLDDKIKEDIALLSAKLEQISLQAAIDWECTSKNVVDKFFSELQGILPRSFFLSACEKKFLPDKVGPGPAEKVRIAECWVYEALPLTAQPYIIAMKLSTLELMANDAACRLRETQSGKGMWKRNAEFGLRYSVWSSLAGKCQNPEDCFERQRAVARTLLASSDPRDIGAAKDRVVKSASITSQPNCGVICFEDALVELYLARSEIKRNADLRAQSAKLFADQALRHLEDAQQCAATAARSARDISKIGQYQELVARARAELPLADQEARRAKATSLTSATIVTSIEVGTKAVEQALANAAKVAAKTIAKEEKAQKRAEKKVRRQIERVSDHRW